MSADPQLGLALPEPEPVHRKTFIPTGYRTAHCKYCKARIIWVVKVDQLGEVKINPRTGEPVREPVDITCDPEGKIVLIGAGRARQLAKGVVFEDDGAPEDRRVSHWATCPERKKAAAARDAKRRKR